MDYNPLTSITLPGAHLSNPTGVVVVVGPNSSGKTLFLQDVEGVLLGDESRQLVVCQDVQLRKPPDFEVFLNDMIRQQQIKHANGVLSVNVPHLGGGRAGRTDAIQKGKLKDFYEGFNTNSQRGIRSLGFFGWVGRALLTSLFLGNRLSLHAPAPRFDYTAQPPQNDLQALFANRPAQVELGKETGRVFGNAAWLDTTRHDTYRLKVSGRREPPPYEDVLDLQKAASYRLIDTEGDGYKAYVGIAVALLLGRRPVCLIDEPELCLHPPQAYALGQFIGQHGTSGGHVTFIATHSSHLLRGVIEKATRLTVIRLTNVNSRFQAHVVDNDLLRATVKRPGTRAEVILDGLFSHGAVIVEAEGDRAVYQAAGQGLDEDFGREVHFVPVQGTGGIAEVAKFYRSLNIPVAVIADLDVVTDSPKVKAFLKELAPPEQARGIIELCRAVEQGVRTIPPALSEQEVRAELLEITDSIHSWAERDDVAARSKLSSLEKRLSRVHRLKAGGVAAFDAYPDIRRDLQEVIDRCRAIGLFLVPGGELESWVPHLLGDISKGNKADWADQAACRIREADTRDGDVWDFVRSVLGVLRARASPGPSQT